MSSARNVVTVILRKDDKILILKRSDKVNSFQGRWSGISGGIEKNETPADAAIRELREETGLVASKKELIAADEPIVVTEGGKTWKVYPFLLSVKSDSISLDWEHDRCEWISPDELKNYDFVPKLDEVIESLLRKREKRE